MKKSFKNWTRDDLFKELGLNIASKMSELADWLSADEEITAEEIEFLNRLAERSENVIDAWNEAELMQKFINKVIDLVDFDLSEYRCTYFAERYLSATVKNCTLHGYADWMVAKGTTQPSHPFFFMHEYKPEGEKQIDGRGQLLALMLATQELNKDGYPIYGCFVHGRMWFFVALKDFSYEISQSFDATRKNELQQILKILKKQKTLIFNRLQKE
jgi:hypothetical protein